MDISVCQEKIMSRTHTDPGRRLLENPTESVKTKLAKRCVCLKSQAPPYPRWDNPRDKVYEPLSCLIDAFLGHIASHTSRLLPHDSAPSS